MESFSHYNIWAYDRRSGHASRTEALRPHFSTSQRLVDAEEAIKDLHVEQRFLVSEGENLKRLLNGMHLPAGEPSNQRDVRSKLEKAITEVEELQKRVRRLKDVFKTAKCDWFVVTDSLTAYEQPFEVAGVMVCPAICDRQSRTYDIDGLEKQLNDEQRTIRQRLSAFKSLMEGAIQGMDDDERTWNTRKSTTDSIGRRIEGSIDRVMTIASDMSALFTGGGGGD